jgi:hypothetical protein
MAYLTRILMILTAALFLTACKGGGAGRSTAPTEEQMMRLNEGKAAAEAAERAYHEKRLERIQLEQQLEDREN